MAKYDYDVIMVGAGPAGYITAARAAKLGLKTAIVEKGTWGGVCLNVGCIPTKTLLKNAKVYHYLQVAEQYGIKINDKKTVTIDWKVAKNRKDKVVQKLTSGVQFLMKTNKVTSMVGTANAIDAHTIEVTDSKNVKNQYTTKYLIIGTGSAVKMFENPNGPKGLSSLDLQKNRALLTSTEILDLERVPKTITIVGGGVIGVEFACLFSSLGTKVTIIEYLDKILAQLDVEISEALEKVLVANNVKILTGYSVTKLEGNKLTYFAVNDKDQKKTNVIESEYILLSTGRVPITNGFDNLGIKVKPNGGLYTNFKMQALDENSKPIDNVYVIGDANGEMMLAHVASAEGLIAVNNIMVQEKPEKYQVQTINYNRMPNCIYTFPEAASVGLTEIAAKALDPNCIVKKMPYAHSGKALADNETDGFVKLIVASTNIKTENGIITQGEILGAHIVTGTATDLISEITNIMNSEATITELANSCHPHPTLSELIMETAQEIDLIINKNKK